MNKEIKITVLGLTGAVILAIFLLLWLRCQRNSQELAENVFFVAEEPMFELMSVDVKKSHGEEVVFTASMDAFILRFNRLFEQDFGCSYFPPPLQWDSSDYGTGIHSKYPTMQFRFSEDERIYSLPTVTVYTPMEEHSIQEITINFDEHSYTEAGYERFKQLCQYTLQVFLPNLSREAVSRLCDQVLALGNEHVFESDAWYGSGAIPCALFYKDGVGIYPYFAIGDWQRLCVIPVTEEILKEFEQKGVELHEIV